MRFLGVFVCDGRGEKEDGIERWERVFVEMLYTCVRVDASVCGCMNVWMCGSGMYRKVDCVIAGKRCANECMRYMDVSFMILRRCFLVCVSVCHTNCKRFHAPVLCTYMNVRMRVCVTTRCEPRHLRVAFVANV